MSTNKFGFGRWKYPFEIDGSSTLDSIADKKVIERVEARRQLFMEPLLRSGFLAGKRVLDLGCNTGYWSLISSKDGKAAFVQGVEHTAHLVEQAEFVFSKYGIDKTRYSLVQGDAYALLDSYTADFDVILCLGFFYHITAPMRLLELMSKACRGYVVLDTVVHPSDEADISVRPVLWNKAEGKMGLELVSSPKAIYWMAEHAGFAETRTLVGSEKIVSSSPDYRRGQRKAFVISKGPSIEAVWPNSEKQNYASIREDFQRFGYFPELRGGRGDAMKERRGRRAMRRQSQAKRDSGLVGRLKRALGFSGGR